MGPSYCTQNEGFRQKRNQRCNWEFWKLIVNLWTDFESLLRIWKLQPFGHIKRQHNTLVSTILEGSVEGKRESQTQEVDKQHRMDRDENRAIGKSQRPGWNETKKMVERASCVPTTYCVTRYGDDDECLAFIKLHYYLTFRSLVATIYWEFLEKTLKYQSWINIFLLVLSECVWIWQTQGKVSVEVSPFLYFLFQASWWYSKGIPIPPRYFMLYVIRSSFKLMRR